MSRKKQSLVGIMIAFALLVPSLMVTAQTPSDAFNRTWERTDRPVAEGQISRTWMWGPFDTAFETTEPYADAPGGERKVAYFDKSRMEITDPSADQSTIWYVTNGLLTIELITGRMQLGHDTFEQHEPAQVNVAGDFDDPSGPTYATFSLLLNEPALASGATITQRVNRVGEVSDDQALGVHGVTAAYLVQVPGIEHQVASVFWTFMNSNATVYENGNYTNAPLFENPFYATGYPVSEAYWANVKVANTYQDVLVQCFERRCLTFNPSNDSGWQVEAGNVGQHYHQWRYTQTPSTPDPVVTPDPTATHIPDSTETPEPPATLTPQPITPLDPTSTPETTATPDATITPSPDPTVTPDPTSTPVTTATPDPTSTPTPTPNGENDTTPPELIAFEFAPTSVDSDTGGIITFTAHLTDDLAGVAGAGYTSSPSQIRFHSPSGTQFVDAVFSDQQRVAGTSRDGVYVYQLTVPAFAMAGVWEVEYFLLVDQVGNQRWLSASDMTTLGFPTTFQVTGSGDTTPPELVNFSFDPSTVDSATGGAITFTAHLTDDLAGVAGAGYTSSPSQVRFLSPSGIQFVDAIFSEQQRVSGTSLDGVYVYQVTVPAFSEAGIWQVQEFLLADQVGNLQWLTASDLTTLGFPTTFEVTGTGDTMPPELAEFSFSPTSVDSASGGTITFTARLTDDLAGVAGAGYTSSPTQVRFRSPSGTQFVDVIFSDQQRISGTALNGVYEDQVTVPAFSATGVWQAEYFLLVDQVGNQRWLTANDMTGLGFPTTFEVK